MSITRKKIYYLGNDDVYFKAISAEFSRFYGSLGLQVEKIFEDDKTKIQAIAWKIFDQGPLLVLVDFSKHPDEYMHLANILIRTNNINPIPVLGLHDYLSSSDTVKESFLNGVRLNHVKGAEILDVVYSALALVDMREVKEHGFAMGEMQRDITVGYLARIGYITDEMIHFETNAPLKTSTEVDFNTLYWFDQKIFTSKTAKVKKISKELLFYSFNHAVDAELHLAPPPKLSDVDDPEKIDEKQDEYQHNLAKVQKKYKSWLEDNKSRSQKKNVRILVIDKGHTFYLANQRTDKYNYMVRCQPYFLNIEKEIIALRPQVIAFSLDTVTLEKDEKQNAMPRNDIETLKILAKHLELIQGYRPSLLIMNCKDLDSKQLQDILHYPQSMAYAGEMNPLVIIKMADILQSKIDKTPEEGTEEERPVVYLKKGQLYSQLEIVDSIFIQKLSETDLIFLAKNEIPPFTTLTIEQPFKAYITIIPHPKFSQGLIHYAVINGINEVEKQSIRRYVNDIFFKDHDEKKQAEVEEFKKLNEDKRVERTNAAIAAALKAIEEANKKKKS